MSAVYIQLRRKGILTLPVSLRRKYDLDENDVFTLEDLDAFIDSLPCYDARGGKPGGKEINNGS